MRVRERRASHARRAVAGLSALALTAGLAACAGGSEDGPVTGQPVSDPEKALRRPTTLTFWTWVPNIERTVALFEEEYPKVDVKVVNVAQGEDHYTKLRTTLKAGKGAPDVAQMEFKNLPGFVLTDSLVNLSDYGADELEDEFTPSAWSQVSVGGDVYGIPQDTGPMVMLYRPAVFDRLGLEVPTTWAEYAAAARTIRQRSPDTYMTFLDPGDPGTVTSLLWQAGSRPFALEGGDELSLDLQDDGARRWADRWTPLLRQGLVEPTTGFTDQWYKAMAGGRYATWLVGAWAPTFLKSVIPRTAGEWRVAPLPQDGGGPPVTSEHGGSSVAVTTQSDDKAAGAAFAAWLNSDPEAARSLNENSQLFPATSRLLDSREFASRRDPFLGGQRANSVFVEASRNVAPGWEYTPFQDYTETVFADTAGQAVARRTDLAEGLVRWQRQLATYARDQGFTVRTGS